MSRKYVVDAWRKEYLPHSQPLMRRQLSRLLTPLATPKAPASSGNLYQMRIFRTRAGSTGAFAALLQNALPAVLQAPSVAVWTGNSGDVNEVVHLSVYPAATPVADILCSRDWREFLKQHGAMVEDIQSSLMTPAPFSPWR